MANDNKQLIKDASGSIPTPQFKDKTTGDFKSHTGDKAPFYQLVDDTGKVIGGSVPINTQLTGSIVTDVTLQNAVSATGNGTAHTPVNDVKLRLEINGTSTSRTINFEMASISGTYIPVTAFNITDPTKYGTSTTGGSNTTPEFWEVDVPAGFSFRARVSAITGGTVTVKGKSKVVA
ncbi:hypothetical protein [Pseudalkalibacillus sp. JSM 102089]|uniref:hypothetical protein n=1 Tax=Pseudalkalibacillus sp. JSM 102089 TaxID=3229856 RepID=UPI003523C320